MKLNVQMAGVVGAGLLLYGCATTSPSPTSKPSNSAAVSFKDPNCLTETGSRTSDGEANCRGFGRSYSDEDISRTGKTSLADALGLLDSSITVHR